MNYDLYLSKKLKDICKSWDNWKDKPDIEKIKIVGDEPTSHPEFKEILRHLYESVKNISYKTSGISFSIKDPRSKNLLEDTKNFCKYILLSWNRSYFNKSVSILKDYEIDYKIIWTISDIRSIDNLLKLLDSHDQDIILTPDMDINQNLLITENVWKYLSLNVLDKNLDNIFLSSRFSPFTDKYLEDPNNILISRNLISITENKYDLRPIKIYKI